MDKTSRRSIKLFLLCGFAICAPAYADNIIYSGSFHFFGNTASYSITTDGALGTLHRSDIVSASFSDRGSFGFLLMDATQIIVGGSALSAAATATASELFFDFADPDNSEVGFLTSGPQYGIIFASAGYAGPPVFNEAFTIIDPEATVGNGYDSNVLIATGPLPAPTPAPTPEPGALVTTLFGSLILGLAALKRRRQALRY